MGQILGLCRAVSLRQKIFTRFFAICKAVEKRENCSKMDIVTRLKMFLEQTGISNSQFADTCDIPRPTLSQLLNGRNKKVSDEVIGKIHRSYPSLNIMWLMFGDGEMLVTGNEQPRGDDHAGSAEGGDEDRFDDPVQRAISFDDDEPRNYRPASRPSQRMATASTMTETIQNIMRSTAAGRPAQRGGGTNDRRVVKMLVFYSDGRFEEFGPTQ